MFLVVSFSVVIAVVVHLVLFRLASPLGLVDLPNERKTHVGKVPVFGGLAILISALASLLFFGIDIPLSPNVLWFTVIILLFGLVDDRHGLSPKVRLIAQIVIAVLSVFIGDLHLYFFGNIFGIGDFYLGFWGELLTILAIVTAINAYNFIDGIDGLLASLLIVLFVALLYIDPFNILLYSVIIANLAIFLLFNLGGLSFSGRDRRVFMGDAGSMAFGYIIVSIFLDISQMPNVEVRPVTVLWLMAVPLMDLVAIFIRRLLKGRPVMKADREHLHHIFLRMGFSDRQALLIITLISAGFAVVGLGAEYLGFNEMLMFVGFFVVFFLYLYFILHAWRFVRLFNIIRQRRKINHASAVD